MIRPILAVLGALFCGSIVAFFLFVPPLLIAAVLMGTLLLLLMGLVLLSRVGIQAELRPAPPSDDIDRTD